MKYAGAELLKEAKSWGDAVLCELGAVSYCDDDIGLDYTYLGYKVAETRGYKVAWDFDVKSPYT